MFAFAQIHQASLKGLSQLADPDLERGGLSAESADDVSTAFCKGQPVVQREMRIGPYPRTRVDRTIEVCGVSGHGVWH
jgi:hypothetical protein